MMFSSLTVLNYPSMCLEVSLARGQNPKYVLQRLLLTRYSTLSC